MICRESSYISQLACLLHHAGLDAMSHIAYITSHTKVLKIPMNAAGLAVFTLSSETDEKSSHSHAGHRTACFPVEPKPAEQSVAAL